MSYPSGLQEAINTWAVYIKNANNPLEVSEELIQQSLKKSRPKDILGAKWVERLIIPCNSVIYSREKQTREKEINNNDQRLLKHDFERYGIILEESVPIVAYDPEKPNLPDGISGYHRSHVFYQIKQDCYMYDMYDFSITDSPAYYMEVARNTTNHHKGYASRQTSKDFIKSASNAVDAGMVQKDEASIRKFVEEISDMTDQVNNTIISEVMTGHQVYPNFRTYSSNRSKDAKNSLDKGVAELGLGKTGLADLDNEKGYILYCGNVGDNQSSWMRAITNSMKYGVPTYIVGYSDQKVECLKTFRTEWKKQFNRQKDLMMQFIRQVSEDSEVYANGSFPVKMAGFLPQYVKPNPEAKGKNTETTLVDCNGKSVPFEIGIDLS